LKSTTAVHGNKIIGTVGLNADVLFVGQCEGPDF